MYTVSQKMRQLWNGIAQNHTDRLWGHLAEIFKILYNKVCMFQFSYRFALLSTFRLQNRTGTLKSRERTSRDLTTRHHIARVDIARLNNAASDQTEVLEHDWTERVPSKSVPESTAAGGTICTYVTLRVRWRTLRRRQRRDFNMSTPTLA